MSYPMNRNNLCTRCGKQMKHVIHCPYLKEDICMEHCRSCKFRDRESASFWCRGTIEMEKLIARKMQCEEKENGMDRIAPDVTSK